MKKIILLITLFAFTKTIGQNANDRKTIIAKTNVIALNQITEKANNLFYNTSSKNNTIKLTITNNKNEIGYFSGFNHQGNPVYDFDDNSNAAITSSVNAIWTGGSSGLNLDGANIEIGHWEASGLSSPEHQELKGKIVHEENKFVTGHATHTAGIMVARGINPEARGMASNATIFSRKSDNDEAELADFAASGGILSNHSYSTGNPNGNISQYGAYTQNAAEWDEILFNAPYLTICKSAGNNRDDGVNSADQGYDIIYTVATSKNLITVGAVNAVLHNMEPNSIVQSAFSNWGPTDDWRIKPDITALGVNMLSADNQTNTSYKTRSGTSMSTPVVTGTIALLQQHYHNLNKAYMKSSTVKALLINTTDELGEHDGPDFQNGWGLLNAERAAEAISQVNNLSLIDELTLINNGSYTTEIEVDGKSPLSLSIAWTDPAGIPKEGEDNQTSVLVNDLDVRISGNGLNFNPWALEPNTTSDNFMEAAFKGDNYRDNVERIDISDIEAGIYTVTVTHKSNLFNSQNQDFSMVITGIGETPYNDEASVSHNDIKISPVPLRSENLNIHIPSTINATSYIIQVFDMMGKLITSETHINKNIEMDLKNLTAGAYIVKVQTGKETFQKKLIVQ